MYVRMYNADIKQARQILGWILLKLMHLEHNVAHRAKVCHDTSVHPQVSGGKTRMESDVHRETNKMTAVACDSATSPWPSSRPAGWVVLCGYPF